MLDLTHLHRALTEAYLAHPIFWDMPPETEPRDIIPASTVDLAREEFSRLVAIMTRKQLRDELGAAVDTRLEPDEKQAYRQGFRWNRGIPEQTIHTAIWRTALTIVGEIHRGGLTSHERMEALARIRRREEV